MCKIKDIKNADMIFAKKNGKQLDYYIMGLDRDEHYLFSRDFSVKCYQKCKSGMPINKLLHDKSKDTAYMKMIKRLNFMMPYFREYYDLEVT